MTIYVDNYLAPYGRMKLCHMTADALQELHSMADQLSIPRDLIEAEPTPIFKKLSRTVRSHLDRVIPEYVRHSLAIELNTSTLHAFSPMIKVLPATEEGSIKLIKPTSFGVAKRETKERLFSRFLHLSMGNNQNPSSLNQQYQTALARIENLKEPEKENDK